MRTYAALLLAFCVMLPHIGCHARLDVTAEVQVQCTTSKDCPDGTVCVEGRDRCLPPGTACVERQGERYVALANGNTCTTDSGEPGICLQTGCAQPRCGDGFVDASNEECDDGDEANGDFPSACRSNCVAPRCGDGIRDLDEDCDEGPSNGDAPSACRGDCTLHFCGDGIQDLDEACDDGNASANDSCHPTCELNVCGDGVIDFTAEACEDGNEDPTDGCDLCLRTAWTAELLLGRGLAQGNPNALELRGIEDVEVDRGGNVFFADSTQDVVWRYDPVLGTVVRFAGTGTEGPGTNRVSALQSQLHDPKGLALDDSGNLYIADSGNHQVRVVDRRSGLIETLAGSGFGGTCSNSTDPNLVNLAAPSDITVTQNGTLFLTDSGCQEVLRLRPALRLIEPRAAVTAVRSIVSRQDGALTRVFVSSPTDGKVYEVDAITGTLSTWAGDGNDCSPATGTCGDGSAATTAQLSYPTGLGLDAGGNLLIADSYGRRLRRVTPAGTISTVAGTGATCPLARDPCGNGASPLAATFSAGPFSAAGGADGKIYIVDGTRVRVISAAADRIDNLAGSGLSGVDWSGGGSLAVKLTSDLVGLAVTAEGGVYVGLTDYDLVYAIEAPGRVRRVAGTQEVECTDPKALCGDGGPATQAQLAQPGGLATDAAGNLYIAEPNRNRIRRVRPDGIIETVAGSGGYCSPSTALCGDGGSAVQAQLAFPMGVAVLGTDLYIADELDHRVRHVDLTGGLIETVAGTGAVGVTGENGAATSAQLSYPAAITIDSAGALYVSDSSRIVKIADDTKGTLVLSRLVSQHADGLAIDQNGGVLYTQGNQVLRLEVVGPVPVAGSGAACLTSPYCKDGELATTAELTAPFGIAIDASGTLYVGTQDGSVRYVAADGRIRTLLGYSDGVVSGHGPLATATLTNPMALTFWDPSHLFVADGSAGRVRLLDLQAQWLSTVVGYGGAPTITTSARYSAPATATTGVLYRASGATPEIWVAEAGILNANRIRRMSLADPQNPESWTVTPVIGDGATCAACNATLTSSGLRRPSGMAFADDGSLYIADTDNHAIRRASFVDNQVTLVAGIIVSDTGVPGFDFDPLGTGVPASEAQFFRPQGVLFDAEGHLLIADTGNHQIRHLDLDTDLITPVLGDGSRGENAFGRPARLIAIDSPIGMTLDSRGNLYVAAGRSVYLVHSGPDGHADGDDEVEIIYGAQPRDTLPAAGAGCLSGLQLEDGESSVLVLDACVGTVVRLSRVREPVP